METEEKKPEKKSEGKLLIVDDDQYLLSIYASKFKDEGFEVTAVNNGKQAWDFLRGGYLPDIVFTGILMPFMTGFELIRNMQADPKLKNIPVAISSHRGKSEDKKAAEDLGVDDFIMQGVTPLNEVVRRIRLLSGVRKVHRLRIIRKELDAEEFVKLMDKEQQSAVGFENDKTAILEVEHLREPGTFKVRLVKEEQK